jgi:hypothetical protein
MSSAASPMEQPRAPDVMKVNPLLPPRLCGHVERGWRASRRYGEVPIGIS